MEEKIRDKNIIELIYQAEEKTLDERIKQANRKVKNEIKDINIKELLENTSNPNELERVFQKIEENYSIKISEYNKNFYEQGFIDGIHLMMNCFK